jgi:hypothetical protein
MNDNYLSSPAGHIPVRPFEYIAQLSGRVSEWAITPVESGPAIFWGKRKPQELFDHVMTVRDDPTECADGTPLDLQLPDWGSMSDAMWLYGVEIECCDLRVETLAGVEAYSINPFYDHERALHIRYKHHYTDWDLVGEAGGCVVAGVEYDGKLTFRFASAEHFDPGLLRLGVSFMDDRLLLSKMVYDGEELQAETGSGSYSSEIVRLSYRNEDGKMDRLMCEIGEYPRTWPPALRRKAA